MNKVTQKKEKIIEKVTQHLIINGLTDVGLRTLAKKAGTSDRMLIYYFETKDGLIREVLQRMSDNFTAQLDAVLGNHQREADTLFHEVMELVKAEQFQLLLCLWFEIVGLAVRKQEPYATIAKSIGQNWLEWIDGRLKNAKEDQAKVLFAKVEGSLMLELIGVR